MESAKPKSRIEQDLWSRVHSAEPLVLEERDRSCLDLLDKDGASLLHYVVLAGAVEKVRILLAAGANPNVRAGEPSATELCELPLDLAMQCAHLWSSSRHQEIVEILRGAGATEPP